MSDIKIKLPGHGKAGSFIVDGIDLSNYVMRDSVQFDNSGDVWVVRVAIAGDVEIDLPDATLEAERIHQPRRLCEGEVD